MLHVGNQGKSDELEEEGWSVLREVVEPKMEK